MRFVIVALLLVFALVGAAFAALNAGTVHYDFLVATLDMPKGVTLLAAIILGWLLGGLSAWAGRGWRMRDAGRRRDGRDRA